MKRRILYLLALFFATVAMMSLQKPLFMLFYSGQSLGVGVKSWFDVIWHGLSLDFTTAGYITFLPTILILISIWVPIRERYWNYVFKPYFVIVSILSAVIFAVDLGLYEHWGFRLDGTILIYLSDPKGVLASLDIWTTVVQTSIFILYAAMMMMVYKNIYRLFDCGHVRQRSLWSLFVLFFGGLLFLAIRGGVGASVANISKVYFSPNLFLNQAAINPIFSLLSTLDSNEDYSSTYPFFEPQELESNFERLRGDRVERCSLDKLISTPRPNIVFVVLESFGRSVVDERVGDSLVAPRINELKKEGVWFENFYANSFRTDRGQVAALSGFPAQTRISIMKLPTKSRNLPSIARSLSGEGYSTTFYYGGDLNFTDQASYMYATGWNKLIWQKGLDFDVAASNWGYDDAVMTDFFADEVIALSAKGEPYLAGLLTLSSHAPFDVPYSKFDNKLLNSMAFTDDYIGRMVDKLKSSAAWDNMLIVMVADHSIHYPDNSKYYTPERHHIPMLWLGGAVKEPRIVDAYASQIDICATILSQMDIDHSDFEYSKDILNSKSPNKFGYYVFNDGFGVIDSTGYLIYDCTTNSTLSATSPGLLDIGKTLLQQTYTDIGSR